MAKKPSMSKLGGLANNCFSLKSHFLGIKKPVALIFSVNLLYYITIGRGRIFYPDEKRRISFICVFF